jgi:hypothetical protein
MLAIEYEQDQSAGVEQAVSDANDAYIYGYPLVTMDMARKLMRRCEEVAAPWGRSSRWTTTGSQLPAPTRYLPPLGSMSPENRGSSESRTWETATT